MDFSFGWKTDVVERHSFWKSLSVVLPSLPHLHYDVMNHVDAPLLEVKLIESDSFAAVGASLDEEMLHGGLAYFHVLRRGYGVLVGDKIFAWEALEASVILNYLSLSLFLFHF